MLQDIGRSVEIHQSASLKCSAPSRTCGSATPGSRGKTRAPAPIISPLKRTAVINMVGLTGRSSGRRRRTWRGSGRAACAAHCAGFPRGDLHGTSQLLDGAVRPATASSATAGTTARWRRRIFGNSPIISWRGRKSGRSAPADAGFTCAQLFWWFNMYSAADYSITPRPSYPADGRKVFDIHTWPYPYARRSNGTWASFPSRPSGGRRRAWMGRTAGRTPPALDSGGGQMDRAKILAHAQPGLSAALDYNLQRHGPGCPIAADVRRD